MQRIPIDTWTLSAIGEALHIPGRVRGRAYDAHGGGYVHETLIAAGVIPPIDQSGGEEQQEWIGRVDWLFAGTPYLDRAMLAHARIDLCFDWLDTVAEMRANGCRVGTSASEFVPFRLAVKAWLRDGPNNIDVRIRGPIAAVEALERRYGARPVNGDWTPYCFLRKCAANFGWDWGPRAASAGVGGARIECWTGVRLASVRPLVVACDEREAVVEVHVECERADDRDATVEVALAGETRTIGIDEYGRATATMRVAKPDRWWPRGFGAPKLYPLGVTLASTGEKIEQDIGLRSVRLLTDPDAHGSRFALEVNGREIWCRGANWVPRTPFPRLAPKATHDLERCAADANLNMLRVWGGGIYESDSFYARCDELGLLVWQDFMFSCATYPEEAPYADLVEAEARAQVTRLSSHPSVVLWCGGNEDILAWWSWGWKERLRSGQSWGRRYWLELLPQVMRELDPTRPYWPESPYSGSMDVHPNDPDHGDRHTWDAKLEQYRTVVPRFCSEFGHQSPPCWESICAVVRDDERVVGNADLARRQRAWGGDAFQYDKHLVERFPPLATLDDWTFAAHLIQARAYELAIVWMRANAPRCMGALFWQLNDVWTGHSWSVVDANGLRKPSYFAVKRACAPLALGVIPRVGDAPGRVVLCRGSGECGADGPCGAVHLRVVDVDGNVLVEDSVELRDDSRWVASASIPASLLEPRDPARSLLVADRGDLRATHPFVFDRDYVFPPQRCRVEPHGRHLALYAQTLSRDVCIAASLEPTDGMFTLLPGETRRVAIGRIVVESDAVLVRTANGVGRAALPRSRS